MILQYGNTKSLAGTPWLLVTLGATDAAETATKRPEGVIRRICEELPGIARGEPIEIFVPVARRDLDVFEMEGGNYIYTRGDDKVIWRMKSVTGCGGLVTDNETQQFSHAIRVDDCWVQGRIRALEKIHDERKAAICEGDFVRILDGKSKDFCGMVTAVNEGYATVLVEFKTKQMVVETPTGNMLQLNHVQENKRVWYYSPMCDGIDPAAMAEDLEHEPFPEEPEEAEEKLYRYRPEFTRKQTATALSISLAMADPDIKPTELTEKLFRAMAEKKIRPTTTRSLYFFIKQAILSANPGVKNWREMIKIKGKAWRFSTEGLKTLSENRDKKPRKK